MQARHHDLSVQYITQQFVVEPKTFENARLLGDDLRPGMQVSPYEGHLLAWLVRMAGAQHGLEIGSFVGYSTLWQASALPQQGKLIALEIDSDHAAHTQRHIEQAGFSARVDVVQADALTYLAHYQGAAFDYVFIDGVKKDYTAYLDALMPHLAPRAWVVADNALLFGAFTGDSRERVSEAARTAMSEYHVRMARGDVFDAVMLPTFEGLLLARKKA